jgi:hypothetical protein
VFEYYGDIYPVEENYDLEEMHVELDDLPEVGIALLEEKELYSIVEELQNSSLLGFQLFNKFDRLTARIDNPNRQETFSIHHQEILNFDTLKIDFGGTDYASYSDIEYAYGYQDDTGLHSINKDYRTQILDVHRFEKPYESRSLMSEKSDADRKAKVIMEIYSKTYPKITGIKLFGLKYFSLRVYDVGYIDMKGIRGRTLVGDRPRVKVVSKKIDLSSGIITIDVSCIERIPDLSPAFDF